MCSQWERVKIRPSGLCGRYRQSWQTTNALDLVNNTGLKPAPKGDFILIYPVNRRFHHGLFDLCHITADRWRFRTSALVRMRESRTEKQRTKRWCETMIAAGRSSSGARIGYLQSITTANRAWLSSRLLFLSEASGVPLLSSAIAGGIALAHRLTVLVRAILPKRVNGFGQEVIGPGQAKAGRPGRSRCSRETTFRGRWVAPGIGASFRNKRLMRMTHVYLR
jgi:hypothetical protein